MHYTVQFLLSHISVRSILSVLSVLSVLSLSCMFYLYYLSYLFYLFYLSYMFYLSQLFYLFYLSYLSYLSCLSYYPFYNFFYLTWKCWLNLVSNNVSNLGIYNRNSFCPKVKKLIRFYFFFKFVNQDHIFLQNANVELHTYKIWLKTVINS